jgi:hypothetical protein
MKEYRLLQFVQRQSTQTFDASRGTVHAPANLEFDGAIARETRLLAPYDPGRSPIPPLRNVFFENNC